MPTYDYFCPGNGKTLEVFHVISRKLETWGELCEMAGEGLGETAAETPIKRLLGTGTLIDSSSSRKPDPGPPSGGGCARPGGCGCH
ncbi:MAG: zinc ribbon domain-containing protein [Planctomycetota bacterium]|jgi:predicted nucleic acid-binding Zn ribbon protein|nr:zinc ribbon domain-containing protein [Planctomycetota bacterium]